MSAEPWPIVHGTGHRTQHLNPGQRAWAQDKAIKSALWLRDHCGTQVIISGLALGWDTWLAQGALAAGLTLGAYVPFPQQAEKWNRDDRHEWQRLRDLADPAHSRMVSATYSTAMFHLRNAAMRQDSDAQIALWMSGRMAGGTWNAVSQAVKHGMPGVWLDPGPRRVRRRLPTYAELGMLPG